MKSTICPICDCHTIKMKTKLREEIFLCKKCGFLTAIPEDNKNIKINYDLMLKSVISVRTKNFKNIITHILKKIKKHEINGLEVGSALGIFMELAEFNNIRMTGIEPMENSFLQAKEKGLKVIKGYYPDDFKENRQFDIIIFNDTLEHIRDINRVIKNCYLSLNENSFLIINLPVSTGILYKTAHMFNSFGVSSFFKRLWQFETESPHVCCFNDMNLKLLMNKHGFVFDSYVKQEVFILKDLKKRVIAGNYKKIYCYIIFLVLVFFKPLINILPKDNKCLFFSKKMQ